MSWQVVYESIILTRLHHFLFITLASYRQNVTLALIEVQDSRCPLNTLCELTGKATAIVEIGSST